MVIDFKGVHFSKSVILYAVFFYVRYCVSYRDLQEIMAERGVEVDHATLNRWVIRYAPQIADRAQKRKRSTLGSRRVDETYIKVKGQRSKVKGQRSKVKGQRSKVKGQRSKDISVPGR